MFKELVFAEMVLDITEAFIEVVKRDREGEVVNKTLLKNCFLLFKKMVWIWRDRRRRQNKTLIPDYLKRWSPFWKRRVRRARSI